MAIRVVLDSDYTVSRRDPMGSFLLVRYGALISEPPFDKTNGYDIDGANQKTKISN